MNKVACSAAIAAGLFAASASSASVVVYNGSNPSPSNYTQSANIFAGAFVSLTQNLLPGDTAQFIYTAITPLKIASIATSGTDANDGNDLAGIRFGFSSTPTDQFSTIVSSGGGSGWAGGTLPGLTMQAGDTLSIYWSDTGATGPVSVTASFDTAAVPLPAALPLLAGALGALGFVRRRAKS
ncbi:MAG: VPLPA-CTERM sorting domain-containing protein [Rhodobacteraceae bacterium]|nr:VPLPA-CTERM sorting domain-containing protein [Paracoccaceae bacterium]